jgi:hypothetical protein
MTPVTPSWPGGAAGDKPRLVSPIDVFGTRPGGRCLPAARRVGAPESPAEAIEEIGMVQVHTCVSVHCDQCGDSLGSPGFEEHYLTEDVALDAAAAQGWRVGPGGRLWCSACGPVLTCEAEGHQFSPWQLTLTAERRELFALPEHAGAIAEGRSVGREYRYCRRCCLHESRVLFLTGADVAGEVA